MELANIFGVLSFFDLSYFDLFDMVTLDLLYLFYFSEVYVNKLHIYKQLSSNTTLFTVKTS